MTERCVALLGRPDEPTDAVQEYCEYLGDALNRQGIALELYRARWFELGWRSALRELENKIAESPEAFFLVQYTALTWSRHGFSWRVLSVIRLLKKSGARCVIMFHDSEGYAGSRPVDRLRRRVQIYTMRKALRLADLAILNVPPENASWVPAGWRKAVCIPVGANLPSPDKGWSQAKVSRTEPPSVVVFSLSQGRVLEREVQTISKAMRYAAEKLGPLRLVVAGRNSETGGLLLKEKLAATRVEVMICGLLAGEELVPLLGSCDVMLFVRGPISSRRGSAIAGIACGLPVVAREGWETAPPITEAGVLLVPGGEKEGFGPALLRVLSDEPYRSLMAERSKNAQKQYFSWDVIAAQYARALRTAALRRGDMDQGTGGRD
jgi:glycosyltransferase involved in cell wall biosynthesis